MVVECIDNSHFGNDCPQGKPIKGNLYEVTGITDVGILAYYLFGFGNLWCWTSNFFREVEINIEDATNEVLNEFSIKVLT
jgi:hypothetical protein